MHLLPAVALALHAASETCIRGSALAATAACCGTYDGLPSFVRVVSLRCWMQSVFQADQRSPQRVMGIRSPGLGSTA